MDYKTAGNLLGVSCTSVMRWEHQGILSLDDIGDFVRNLCGWKDYTLALNSDTPVLYSIRNLGYPKVYIDLALKQGIIHKIIINKRAYIMYKDLKVFEDWYKSISGGSKEIRPKWGREVDNI